MGIHALVEHQKIKARRSTQITPSRINTRRTIVVAITFVAMVAVALVQKLDGNHLAGYASVRRATLQSPPRRALSSTCDVSKMGPVKLSNGGFCTPEETHVPTLYDRRPAVQKHYAVHMTRAVVGHDRVKEDLPQLKKITNATFAIWDSQRHYTEASAWTQDGSFVMEGPGWIEPKSKKPTHVLIGNHVGYTTWFAGIFGHHYDDHLPSIAYLRTQVPKDYKFILLDTKLGRAVLKFLDPDFYQRVVWVQEHDVVLVLGNLYVTRIHPTYPLMWGCNRPYDYLRAWIQEKKPDVPTERNVVFYSRASSDTTHGRVLDKQLEQQILQRIRNAMVKYNRPEKDIVVFTGQDENGKTLSVEEQFRIFRSAKTIIGPHGAGMLANLLWVDPRPMDCHNRVQALEFIPGEESTQVQPLYHSMHMRWRNWPVDFNVLLFTKQSTPKITRINLDDFDDALEGMWGGHGSGGSGGMSTRTT